MTICHSNKDNVLYSAKEKYPENSANLPHMRHEHKKTQSHRTQLKLTAKPMDIGVTCPIMVMMYPTMTLTAITTAQIFQHQKLGRVGKKILESGVKRMFQSPLQKIHGNA